MWPADPVLYEINAWTWLTSLERRSGRVMTLADIPASIWDELAALQVDAVWLMGVWERSLEGARIARFEQGLEPAFRQVLPDFSDPDVPGSPYCIRSYTVDPRFGGNHALRVARRRLADRGLKLVLDFVPNHVAPDHSWRSTHPEYLIAENGGFARGRDPYFPPWPDTLQLDAFHPGLRQAAAATLQEIASLADGVRCDMAMLVLNDIFASTWQRLAPATEYWADVIGAVKPVHPEFLWIAEAYWDLEWRLQQLGFDYCYDKRLYDRLEQGDPNGVEGHLRAAPAYQRKLIRFLENHDEPRARTVFGVERQRAAAVIAFTSLGAKLIHEGQIDGHQIKLPVQLGRRPEEPTLPHLREFYERLLALLGEDGFRDSRWEPCRREGWPDNQTCRNLLAWVRTAQNGRRWLVVVNFSSQRSQARVRLPWDGLAGRWWELSDPIEFDRFPRDGDELAGQGLFVDLPAWNYHILELRAA
jgi:glycosidase